MVGKNGLSGILYTVVKDICSFYHDITYNPKIEISLNYLGSVSSPLCVWNLENCMQSNTTVSQEVYLMT